MTTRSPPNCRTCSAVPSRRTTFTVFTPASFASAMMYCPTDEQKVRWIDRRRFHRDQNILRPKSLFWGGGELDDIRRFAMGYELQLPHRIAHILLLVHRGCRLPQT